MSEFNEEQFIALIHKAERDADKNLTVYKLRLWLFAILGYVVIFFILAALIILAGGTLTIAFFSSSLFLLLLKKKVLIIVFVAIWTFLKALWIKFEAPSGYELQRADFPELFQEIDSLTKELDALKIHQVILEDNLNAGVVQSPRFGILGGQRNTLLLGLQLMLALPPEGMRAVLAHEFGHLSGNHSSFSGWIYRVRLTWQRVMEALEKSESFGAGMMRRFFDWYAPKFAAYSFVLARSNEYEADQAAAELTSAATIAEALVNIHAKAPYIDQEYWNVFFKQADEVPAPTEPPFEGLANFLKSAPIDQQQLATLIEKEMQVETHYADTHPALKDRVAAINGEAMIPEVFESNAAELWFSSRYQDVLTHFDELWLENNQERWQERYQYVVSAKQLLKEIKNEPLEEADADRLWDAARAAEEFEDDDAALPLYQRYQTIDPGSTGAAYCIGRILASVRDEGALENLEIALHDSDAWEDVTGWGYHLLLELKREREAENWKSKALAIRSKQQEAYNERANLIVDNDLIAPHINSEKLDQLINQLQRHKNVGSAWLAQKVVIHHPKDSVYAVVFRPKGFYWSFDRVIRDVTESLKLDMDCFVVCLWGDTGKLGKKIKQCGKRII